MVVHTFSWLSKIDEYLPIGLDFIEGYWIWDMHFQWRHISIRAVQQDMEWCNRHQTRSRHALTIDIEIGSVIQQGNSRKTARPTPALFRYRQSWTCSSAYSWKKIGLSSTGWWASVIFHPIFCCRTTQSSSTEKTIPSFKSAQVKDLPGSRKCAISSEIENTWRKWDTP